MPDSDNQIQIIPLIIGLIVIIAMCYIISILLPPYLFYIFIALVVVGLGVIIYFCVKNLEFREKTLSKIKQILAAINKLGIDVIRHFQQGEREVKKKQRIPIPEKTRMLVLERSGDKCAMCGEESNLELHHINKNPSNNSLNNLIALCPTHHSKAQQGGIPIATLKSKIKHKTQVVNKKKYI